MNYKLQITTMVFQISDFLLDNFLISKFEISNSKLITEVTQK